MTTFYEPKPVESMPVTGTGRGRNASPNPYLDPLRESYENERPMLVEVPSIDAAQFVYGKVRNAATRLEIGARVAFTDPRAKDPVKAAVAYRATPVLDAQGNPVRKQYTDADGTPLVDEDGSPEMYTVNEMRFVRVHDGSPYKGPLNVHFIGTSKRVKQTKDEAEQTAE